MAAKSDRIARETFTDAYLKAARAKQSVDDLAKTLGLETSVVRSRINALKTYFKKFPTLGTLPELQSSRSRTNLSALQALMNEFNAQTAAGSEGDSITAGNGDDQTGSVVVNTGEDS